MTMLLSACGDSPASPSGDLSGAWTGSWQFRTAGVTVTDAVTATFTASGANATGSWAAAGGASGQLTINAGSRILGSLTITQTHFTGQVCTGTTIVSGTATATEIDLIAADITPAGTCQWATEMRFTLRR